MAFATGSNYIVICTLVAIVTQMRSAITVKFLNKIQSRKRRVTIIVPSEDTQFNGNIPGTGSIRGNNSIMVGRIRISSESQSQKAHAKTTFASALIFALNAMLS